VIDSTVWHSQECVHVSTRTFLLALQCLPTAFPVTLFIIDSFSLDAKLVISEMVFPANLFAGTQEPGSYGQSAD